MSRNGKIDGLYLSNVFAGILKGEQNSSRLLSHMVDACWKLHGADQARVMMYTLGRIAGTDLCVNLKSEYSINQEMNWNEFLESLEVFGRLFFKTTVKVQSNSEEKVVIRVTDSPCCHKLTGYDQPCCDYLAGIFASYASFVFKGLETTCNELTCKATGYTPFCDFELKIYWNK